MSASPYPPCDALITLSHCAASSLRLAKASTGTGWADHLDMPVPPRGECQQQMGGEVHLAPPAGEAGVGPGRGAADHRHGPDLQHAVKPVLEEDLEQGGSTRGASVEVPSGKNGSLWRMQPRSNLNHW
jgi:hypothetical protein